MSRERKPLSPQLHLRRLEHQEIGAGAEEVSICCGSRMLQNPRVSSAVDDGVV